QRADPRPGVVAHERADLDSPAVPQHTAHLHVNRPIVVAQIARLRAGAEVDPLADIGMSEEPVVALVAITLEEALLDLAPDPALRPDTAAANPCCEHLRVRADVAWAFQSRERLHHRTAVDQHRTSGRIHQD